MIFQRGGEPMLVSLFIELPEYLLFHEMVKAINNLQVSKHVVFKCWIPGEIL